MSVITSSTAILSQFAVGDEVKVIDNSGNQRSSVGDIGILTKIDYDDGFLSVDRKSDGVNISMFAHRFEKVAQEHVVIPGDIEVGDLARVTDPGSNDIEAGQVVEVDRLTGTFLYPVGHDGGYYRWRFERVAKVEDAIVPEIEAGTVIEIQIGVFGFHRGDRVTVKRVNASGVVYVETPGYQERALWDGEFKVMPVLKPAEPEPLKVGERVRVIGNLGSPLHYIPEGNVVEIVRDYTSYKDTVRVRGVVKRREEALHVGEQTVHTQNLERTEDAVTPLPFKKGEHVRVTGNEGSPTHYVAIGTVVEVNRDHTGGSVETRGLVSEGWMAESPAIHIQFIDPQNLERTTDPLTPVPLKVGDRVKVVGNHDSLGRETTFHYLEVGSVAEVRAIGSAYVEVKGISKSSGRTVTQALVAQDVERTDEPLSEEEPSLKVGTVVKVIANNYDHIFPIGNVGVITQGLDSDGDYEIRCVDEDGDEITGYVTADDIEATTEAVTLEPCIIEVGAYVGDAAAVDALPVDSALFSLAPSDHRLFVKTAEDKWEVPGLVPMDWTAFTRRYAAQRGFTLVHYGTSR